jgi:hypothetical protein
MITVISGNTEWEYQPDLGSWTNDKGEAINYRPKEQDMSVRCKFKCSVIKQTADYSGRTLYGVEMYPITNNTVHAADGGKHESSEENKAFFSATPIGKFEVSSINYSGFEVGKEYYLDITPCE